jgi:serine/threonine protein kinase/uncharacterized SAM-binding protein YcdF (DUF218 family)/SAM-dependent methyltransferase/GNAT superfamily N-acetyltransferase/predicted MPP superfamily phosphohydrolase
MFDARSNTLKERPQRVSKNALWSFFIRPVAVITLVAFITTILPVDAAWAARTSSGPSSVGPVRGSSQAVSFKEINVETFAIPDHIGKVKDYYKADSDRIVIHIQDAHCNYYCQMQAARIIDYLSRVYGIDVIDLEGGEGDYDLGVFTSIKDRSIRLRVSDYFVREGLINGAEFLAINSSESLRLWGVEKASLYLENLGIYRSSLKYKASVDKSIRSISHILNKLKIHVFTKELLELDTKYAQYKAGNIEFKDYLAYLMGNAKSHNIDVKAYKNIHTLSQAIGEEETIDFKATQKERDELVEKLKSMLSRNEMEELVLKMFEFKNDKISQADFYRHLTLKAKEVGMKMEDYPELERYVDYIFLYASMDKVKTVMEMDSLEAAIRAVMCKNDTQRELDILSKNLVLMKNIFNISLTREDYRYYLDNEDSFSVRKYADFIKRYAPAYGVAVSFDNGMKDLDSYRKEMVKFFECSIERDEAFVRNIKFGIHPSTSLGTGGPGSGVQKKKIAVMMTGGFHAENLGELFKKNNISYISILPTFKNPPGYKSPYFDLLSGKRSPVEEKLATATGSSLAIVSALNRLGLLVEGEAKERVFNLYVKWKTASENDKGLLIVKGDKIAAAIGKDGIEDAALTGKNTDAIIQGRFEVVRIEAPLQQAPAKPADVIFDAAFMGDVSVSEKEALIATIVNAIRSKGYAGEKTENALSKFVIEAVENGCKARLSRYLSEKYGRLGELRIRMNKNKVSADEVMAIEEAEAKATGETEVRVVCSIEEGSLKIEVSNNSELNEDLKNRIEENLKADPAARAARNMYDLVLPKGYPIARKIFGSGVGISMIKKMAEDAGGSINYSSEGGWTTFGLTLPKAPKAEAKRVKRVKQPDEWPAGGSARYLQGLSIQQIKALAEEQGGKAIRLAGDAAKELRAPSLPIRYNINWAEVLGEGGSAVVYDGTDLVLPDADERSHVAVKVLDPKASLESKLIFLREAAILKRLGGTEGVVGIRDFFFDEENEQYYLVMDSVGKALDDILLAGNFIAADDALRLAVSLIKTVGRLNEKGIWHADIKPGNIFIPATIKDGREVYDFDNAVLGDFGIALDANSVKSGITKFGDAVTASPAYTAPEVLLGNGYSDSTDLYGVGASLYFAIEGRNRVNSNQPFVVMSEMQQALKKSQEAYPVARKDVPDGLKNLIGALIKNKASDRPASIADALAILDALAAPLKQESIAKKVALSFATDQDAIIKLLEESNWYYQRFNDDEKARFRKQVFGGLKSQAVKRIKDLVLKKLRAMNVKADESSIVSVMAIGSWCYGLSVKPSDLDIVVIVDGLKKNMDLARIQIHDPAEWFTEEGRYVDTCQIKMMSKDLIDKKSGKDERQLEEEGEVWGHGVLIDGERVLMDKPSNETLRRLARKFFIWSSIMSKDLGNNVPEARVRNLNKVMRRWGEGMNILSVFSDASGQPASFMKRFVEFDESMKTAHSNSDADKMSDIAVSAINYIDDKSALPTPPAAPRAPPGINMILMLLTGGAIALAPGVASAADASSSVGAMFMGVNTIVSMAVFLGVAVAIGLIAVPLIKKYYPGIKKPVFYFIPVFVLSALFTVFNIAEARFANSPKDMLRTPIANVKQLRNAFRNEEPRAIVGEGVEGAMISVKGITGEVAWVDARARTKIMRYSDLAKYKPEDGYRVYGIFNTAPQTDSGKHTTLVASGGKEIRSFNEKASSTGAGGAIFVRYPNGAVWIVRKTTANYETFLKKCRYDIAVQAGPLLKENGVIQKDLPLESTSRLYVGADPATGKMKFMHVGTGSTGYGGVKEVLEEHFAGMPDVMLFDAGQYDINSISNTGISSMPSLEGEDLYCMVLEAKLPEAMATKRQPISSINYLLAGFAFLSAPLSYLLFASDPSVLLVAAGGVFGVFYAMTGLTMKICAYLAKTGRIKTGPEKRLSWFFEEACVDDPTVEFAELKASSLGIRMVHVNKKNLRALPKFFQYLVMFHEMTHLMAIPGLSGELVATLFPFIGAFYKMKGQWIISRDLADYDMFISENMPNSEYLPAGVSGEIKMIAENNKARGLKTSYLDACGGLGYAATEASLRFKKDGLQTYLADLVSWNQDDIPGSMRRDLQTSAVARNVPGDILSRSFDKFIQSDVSKLKMPEKMDIITMMQGMQYMDDPMEAVVNLYNNLKEGGVLIAGFGLPIAKDADDQTNKKAEEAMKQLEAMSVAMHRMGIKTEYKIMRQMGPDEDVITFMIYIERSKRPQDLILNWEPSENIYFKTLEDGRGNKARERLVIYKQKEGIPAVGYMPTGEETVVGAPASSQAPALKVSDETVSKIAVMLAAKFITPDNIDIVIKILKGEEIQIMTEERVGGKDAQVPVSVSPVVFLGIHKEYQRLLKDVSILIGKENDYRDPALFERIKTEMMRQTSGKTEADLRDMFFKATRGSGVMNGQALMNMFTTQFADNVKARPVSDEDADTLLAGLKGGYGMDIRTNYRYVLAAMLINILEYHSDILSPAKLRETLDSLKLFFGYDFNSGTFIKKDQAVADAGDLKLFDPEIFNVWEDAGIPVMQDRLASVEKDLAPRLAKAPSGIIPAPLKTEPAEPEQPPQVIISPPQAPRMGSGHMGAIILSAVLAFFSGGAVQIQAGEGPAPAVEIDRAAEAAAVTLNRDADNNVWWTVSGRKETAKIGMSYSPTAPGRHINSYKNKYAELLLALLDEKEGGKGHAKALKDAGCDYIRLYAISSDDPKDIEGVKKILQRVHEQYGIKVLLGNWAGLYAEKPDDKEAAKKDVARMVERYAKEPWLLCYQIGNENNYYLKGIGSLSGGNKWDTINMTAAEYYIFMNDLAKTVKAAEKELGVSHPVLLGVGAEFVAKDARASEEQKRMIKDTCTSFDAAGLNLYTSKEGFVIRLKDLRDKLGLPVMISEFGMPSTRNGEKKQAEFIKEIADLLASQAAGMKGPGNVIGFTAFEATDEAWKTEESPEAGHYGVLGKSAEKMFLDARKSFDKVNAREKKGALPAPGGIKAPPMGGFIDIRLLFVVGVAALSPYVGIALGATGAVYLTYRILALAYAAYQPATPRVPPMGEGMNAEQVREFAARGTPVQLINYLNLTGLFDLQEDIIRDALRPDPARLAQFEKLLAHVKELRDLKSKVYDKDPAVRVEALRDIAKFMEANRPFATKFNLAFIIEAAKHADQYSYSAAIAAIDKFATVNPAAFTEQNRALLADVLKPGKQNSVRLLLERIGTKSTIERLSMEIGRPLTSAAVLLILFRAREERKTADTAYLKKEIEYWSGIESEHKALPTIGCKIHLHKKQGAQEDRYIQLDDMRLAYDSLGVAIRDSRLLKEMKDVEYEIILPPSFSYKVITGLLHHMMKNDTLDRERHVIEAQFTFEGNLTDEAKYIEFALLAGRFYEVGYPEKLVTLMGSEASVLISGGGVLSAIRTDDEALEYQDQKLRTDYLGLLMPYFNPDEPGEVFSLSNEEVLWGVGRDGKQKIMLSFSNAAKDLQLLNFALMEYLKPDNDPKKNKKLSEAYERFKQNVITVASEFGIQGETFKATWLGEYGKETGIDLWSQLYPYLKKLHDVKMDNPGFQPAFANLFNGTANKIAEIIGQEGGAAPIVGPQVPAVSPVPIAPQAPRAPPTVLSDLKQINAIFDSIYSVENNYAPASFTNDPWRRPPDAYFEKLLKANGQPISDAALLLDNSVLILEREAVTNKIIGFAVWGNDWQHDQGAAYLAHMAVASEHQGQGNGAQLLDRVVDATVKAGKRRLKFEVRQVTGRAAFYETYANRKKIPFTKIQDNEQFSYVLNLEAAGGLPGSESAPVAPPAPEEDLTGNIAAGLSAKEEIAWRGQISVNSNKVRDAKENRPWINLIAKRCVKLLARENELRAKLKEAGVSDMRINVAINALKNPLVRFQYFDARVEGTEKYMLGHKYALAVNIISQLDRWERSSLEAGMIKKADLIDEYILHEALEKIDLGHEAIVTFTNSFFDMPAFEKRGQTPLGQALRAFIEMKVKSLAPVQSMNVPFTLSLLHKGFKDEFNGAPVHVRGMVPDTNAIKNYIAALGIRTASGQRAVPAVKRVYIPHLTLNKRQMMLTGKLVAFDKPDDALPRQTVELLRKAAKDGLFELVELNTLDDYKKAAGDLNINEGDFEVLLQSTFLIFISDWIGADARQYFNENDKDAEKMAKFGRGLGETLKALHEGELICGDTYLGQFVVNDEPFNVFRVGLISIYSFADFGTMEKVAKNVNSEYRAMLDSLSEEPVAAEAFRSAYPLSEMQRIAGISESTEPAQVSLSLERIIEIMQEVRKDMRSFDMSDADIPKLYLGVSIDLARRLREEGVRANVWTTEERLRGVGERAILHYWVETDKYLLDAFPEGIRENYWKEIPKKYLSNGIIVIEKSKGLPATFYASGEEIDESHPLYNVMRRLERDIRESISRAAAPPSAPPSAVPLRTDARIGMEFLAQRDVPEIDQASLENTIGAKQADAVLLFGSSEIETAEKAAELYNKGLTKKIVIAGGIGRETGYLIENIKAGGYRYIIEKIGKPEDKISESAIFREILLSKSVKDEDILIDENSTNAQQNVELAFDALEKSGVTPESMRTMILIQHSALQRRAVATFDKVVSGEKYAKWGMIQRIGYAAIQPDVERMDTAKKSYYLGMMVGEVKRLQEYYPKFITEVEVPDEVKAAAKQLKFEYVKMLMDETREAIQSEQQNGMLAEKISDIRSDKGFIEGRIACIPDKEGQLIVIGDTHGDPFSTKQILAKTCFSERVKKGEKLHVVFLGDYVDQGKDTVENLMTILELKKSYPQHVTILAGNHEYIDENLKEAEVYKRYHPEFERNDWIIDTAPKNFLDSLRMLVRGLPVMAVTKNGIVLAHSGVPSLETQGNEERSVRGLLSLKDDATLQEEMLANFVNSVNEEEKDRKKLHPGEEESWFKYWTGKTSFDRFMDSVGGKIMVRGHDKNAGASTTLFNDRFITVISTGTASPESGVQYKGISPRYAVFDLSKSYTRIDPKQDIVSIAPPLAPIATPALIPQAAVPVPVIEPKVLAEAQIEAAKQILRNVRFASEPRIIFIENKDEVNKAIHQANKSEMKRTIARNYGTNITIIFHDGSEEGLQKAYDSVKSELVKPKALALAYIGKDQFAAAERVFGSDNKQVKWVQEDVPEGAIIDEVMHVVLGLGILDYVRSNYAPEYDKTRLLKLIEQMVADPANIELLKKDFNNIFKAAFALKIKKIDFKEIQDWKHAQDQVLRSL